MKNFSERAKLCKNPLGRKLFSLMDEKKTNLALSADVTTAAELIALADRLGPEIAVLKTHIDIVSDFSWQLIEKLTVLAKQHQFIIFEDRKFADIGHTVFLQYTKGIYRIAEWASLTNAHTVPGIGVIEGLKKGGMPHENALLLLAEMSSKGNLAKDDYTAATLAMAKQHEDFVVGFIAQHRLCEEEHFLYLAPGIKFAGGKDDLGQQYVTPEQAISEKGIDIIIVGRGIYGAGHPETEARRYREAGWDAYQKRLSI